jgi:hypothetical protein
VDALPVVLLGALLIDPLALGGLEGELGGEADEADPALDGLAAAFSRGWPFESLQCVEAEIRGLLAPAAGGEFDCAYPETAPKHINVAERQRSVLFMGTPWAVSPFPTLTLAQQRLLRHRGSAPAHRLNDFTSENALTAPFA